MYNNYTIERFFMVVEELEKNNRKMAPIKKEEKSSESYRKPSFYNKWRRLFLFLVWYCLLKKKI